MKNNPPARLTVIGCRAGSPDQDTPASGYLVQTAQTTLLIDCGPGVVLKLASLGLLDTLDAVIITHRHADHCADLIALAYRRLFPQAKPPLPLFGPPDLERVLTGFNDLFGIPSLPTLAEPLTTSFAFQPVEPGHTFRYADLTIDTLAGRHPVPTLVLSLPELGLVYSSDGALTDALIDFAAGCRTLVAEATYPSADGHDLHSHGHMTAHQAGELACQVAAEQLVLTHFSNLADVTITQQYAATVFAGLINVAKPGLVVELG